MQHEVAEAYFNEPVDAEGLGIPEYHDLIKVGVNLMSRLSVICAL